MKVVNRKARYEYELLERFEAGIVLTGAEVKSVKAGRMQLKGAFLHIVDNELWLKNSFIAKYGPAGKQPDYKTDRDRKVLVHKKEIKRLIGKSEAEGLTIVPISVYTRGNLLKLEFALARGKKKHEKRETIKKREVQRQIRREMKD